MAIVQCENNHYFDNVKFKECPHCKRAEIRGEDPAKFIENITVAKIKDFSDLKTKQKEVDVNSATVPKLNLGKNINPVAGWMVCVAGENCGRSFEIHIGKNYVGRSMKMDISTNDEQISRENHFSVIYEPKSNGFFVMEGNGITYLNETMLSGAVNLNEGDEIEAGSSRYVFVPYCKEGRVWSD